MLLVRIFRPTYYKGELICTKLITLLTENHRSESNKTSKIYNPSYGTEIGEVLCATNDGLLIRLLNLADEASKN